VKNEPLPGIRHRAIPESEALIRKSGLIPKNPPFGGELQGEVVDYLG
jgi:hypothetical protein